MIDVNGQEISPGDCGYFLVNDPMGLEFSQERRENPVVPPAPDIPLPESPDRPVGSPILP